MPTVLRLKGYRFFFFSLEGKEPPHIQPFISWSDGMSTLAIKFEPLAVDVSFTDTMLRVALADGREVSSPLAWFPRLLNATAEKRRNWRLIGGGIGIHWESLDEDISVESLRVCSLSNERAAIADARSFATSKNSFISVFFSRSSPVSYHVKLSPCCHGVVLNDAKP
ncbi:MAG: DUF2442 domain-containing protein [Nitrospiraceae bacterium]